jgi:hypothetical protein
MHFDLGGDRSPRVSGLLLLLEGRPCNRLASQGLPPPMPEQFTKKNCSYLENGRESCGPTLHRGLRVNLVHHRSRQGLRRVQGNVRSNLLLQQPQCDLRQPKGGGYGVLVPSAKFAHSSLPSPAQPPSGP